MTAVYKRFVLILIVYTIPIVCFAGSKLKLDISGVVVGETLNYKATWGFLTIGSGYTRIDREIHKVGSNICYKVDIMGQTNGLAKLFYVKDRWTSYIDTATITTHKSFRSIREGRHELDEFVYFDQQNKVAEVKVMDKKTKLFNLKKRYDTPETIRDVVAGFMVFRLVDLSKYSKGEVFTINGFYEDEGYKIDVVYLGEEYVKTSHGKIRCYKMKPVLPKNNVFSGRDAVDVWLAADKSKSIIRIKAKLSVGSIVIELDD